MPKIVDRVARRRLIVDTLLLVADRDGLGSATSRAIAAELGVATSSLWHYFPSFDAVLSEAFDTVIARTEQRIHDQATGLDGIEALRSMLSEVFPMNSATESEARIVVSFWGRVASISSLAASVSAVDVRWRSDIAGHLHEAVTIGELMAEAPVTALVDVLMSIISGQQVVSVTGGTVVDPTRQMNMIETILRPYLRTPPRPSSSRSMTGALDRPSSGAATPHGPGRSSIADAEPG